MIELIDIRVFSKLSELMSFSAVARVLAMPKSSVSRSLSRLEEHLGVALIIRSNRKVTLTDTGVLFAESAKKILNEVEEAEEKVGQVRLTPRGLLRVSSPVTPGQFMIAPLVPEYLAAYPDVQVSLELTSSKIEPLTDEMDVVIRTGALEDSRLIAKRLGSARLVLVSTPAYLRKSGAPESPVDLPAHFLLDIADGPGEWRLRRDEEVSTIGIHPRFFANDTSTLRTVLLSGSGLAWLPDYLCRQDIAEGRLVRVMPDWERGEREINAVFPRHRTLSPKVRSFVDFLAAHFNSDKR
ncbi:LysR substrate-binding domain-containing protein [Paraburkholderia nemoris]|uniref:LysR family transcriptional regulator n=1 Tax=Paraburkholderia nemoris TaxID=2793076 RepID=UPI0038B90353